MKSLRRYSPWCGLHAADEARADHLKALRELQADSQAWGEFGFLYENLSILDGKSASLLQFNSVILAVVAIFYAFVRHAAVRGVLFGGLLLSVVSCLLCLAVVWVHWSETASLRDSATHGVVLLRVRDERTVLFRVAWWLAVLSLLGLLGGIALSVVVL